MSLSSLIRVALKTFIAGNGFVGARPPIPTNLERFTNSPAETPRPATEQHYTVPEYSEAKMQQIREQNIREHEARLSNLQGDNEQQQINERHNMPWHTDVGSFSNAPKWNLTHKSGSFSKK
jgi:hypothetical protein